MKFYKTKDGRLVLVGALIGGRRIITEEGVGTYTVDEKGNQILFEWKSDFGEYLIYNDTQLVFEVFN